MDKYLFNSIDATDILLYPLKTSQKQKFSNIFRGIEKEWLKWFKKQKCNPRGHAT